MDRELVLVLVPSQGWEPSRVRTPGSTLGFREGGGGAELGPRSQEGRELGSWGRTAGSASLSLPRPGRGNETSEAR